LINEAQRSTFSFIEIDKYVQIKKKERKKERKKEK
jgi:hypothetical protein